VEKKLSVIIPTLNAEPFIEEQLKGLLEQRLPPDEIIVIDSSSEDRTCEIAESFGVTVERISRESFGHGSTRNACARKSKGDILVFMSQDAVPAHSRLLEWLISPLGGDIAASYACHVPRSDSTPPEVVARRFNYPRKPLIKSKADLPTMGIKTFFFSNVCSAIRRDCFEEVGGFPEEIVTNEDMIFAAKLIMRGYKIAYVPQARVYHSHNFGLMWQMKRYFDIGSSLSTHRWIVEYDQTEKEGRRLLTEQLKYTLGKGDFKWVPYTILEGAMKYTGFKLGLSQERLPDGLKKRLSLHRKYWENLRKEEKE
jgi:rhamnosyltransferase